MNVTCLACGQKNRIPAKRLSAKATCGKCKKGLPPLAEPVDTGVADFDALLEGSSLPVVVDFWAPWCGPCRMVAPTVAQVAKDFAGKAIVAKINTQDHPALAQRYGVRGIPNFAVFSGQKMRAQQAGLMSLDQMRHWVQQNIDA